MCVVRRIAPLGVDVDAVVVRVPSHVAPVRKGRHRQWRCHLQARSLVLDTEHHIFNYYSRFGSRLLAAPLPRCPPACSDSYTLTRPRLGLGASRLTPRRPRQSLWHHRRHRSALLAPAWPVPPAASPPASALAPVRSAPHAVLSSLRSLPIIYIKFMYGFRRGSYPLIR